MPGIRVKALLKAVNAQFPDVAVLRSHDRRHCAMEVLAMITGASGLSSKRRSQPENVVASLRSALNSKRLNSQRVDRVSRLLTRLLRLFAEISNKVCQRRIGRASPFSSCSNHDGILDLEPTPMTERNSERSRIRRFRVQRTAESSETEAGRASPAPSMPKIHRFGRKCEPDLKR